MAHKGPKFVQCRNDSKYTINIPDLGVEDLAPGETAPIPEGYARPRRSHAGERFPSVLEQLAGCPGCPERTNGTRPDGSPNHVPHCMLVPANAEDAERFSKAPDHEDAKPKPELPTVASLVAAGMSPGAAEVFVKGMLAAIEAAKAPAEGEAAKEPPKPKAPKAKPADAQ